MQLCEGWKQAFPDAHGHILTSLASESLVALELRWTGTQHGPLATPAGELPTSGRAIDVQAAMWLVASDASISEVRHQLDMLTMLTQLGAIPAAE